MTREHVSSFVSDLVTMAQAMERLPEVQAELESALNVVGTQADAIQRLELRIIDLKNISDTHLATIRTLEVARDDAELRFLEADERTIQALAFVRTVFGNAGSLIQALDPPRVVEPNASETQPEPVAQPAKVEVTTSAPFSALAPDGTVSPGEQHPDVAADAAEPTTQEPVSVQADPTTATTHASLDKGWTQTGIGDATSAASVSTEPTAPPSLGPYHGRRYFDVPYYVSLTDWIADGGTEENYYASRKPNAAE